MNSSKSNAIKDQAEKLLADDEITAACDLYEQICQMDPGDSEARMTLGNILLKQGKTSEARNSYRKAIEMVPDLYDGWLLLGCAHALCGEREESSRCFLQAESLTDKPTEAWLRIAGIFRLHCMPHDAAEAYRHALVHSPHDPDIWIMLGNTCRETGDIRKAIEAYQHACPLQPDNLAIWEILAELQLQAGFYGHAIDTCRSILYTHPAAAFAHGIMGTALQCQGNLVEAKQSLERCVTLQPGNAVNCYKFACILQTLGELDTALHYFNQARGLAPGMSVAVGGLARVYAQKNDETALRELLEPLIKAADKDPLVLPTLASIAPRFELTAKTIEMLRHAITNRRLPHNVLARLHWALGTLHDALHKYDDAFISHTRSKSLATFSYNAVAHTDFTNRLINEFSLEFLASAPQATGDSQLPVFIVGMPRSGTSLVEQILASHPKVHGAGELPHVTWIANTLSKMTSSAKSYPDCIRELKREHLNECAARYLEMLKQSAPDAQRITDKMPHNFRHLGLIQLLFPAARVIHVVRDPMDTCLSCYFQEFSAAHAYTRSLRDLGAHYRDYERLMQHWHNTLTIPILTLHYEDVVSNLGEFSRKLIAFCDLEWDDACLDFHRQDRVVQTLSAEQVRRPIYSSSVGRWKNYRSHLAELLEILGRPSS